MLNQRKDEVAKMDNRIHELQQRLKKKRAQQAEHQKNAENKKMDNKITNRPSNIAQVEPYIQYNPNVHEKNDVDLKSGFAKQNPKYQTLPPNTKFPMPETGKMEDSKGLKEQNNNSEKQDVMKPVHIKESDKRVISNGPTVNQVSDSVIRAAQRHQAGGQPVAPSQSGPQPRKPPPPPLPVRSATTGLTHFTPRPFGSTYSTSVLNNKPYSSVQQQNVGNSHNGPTINVQDDIRTGGSGQSSPASSDSSQKDVQVVPGKYNEKQNGDLTNANTVLQKSHNRKNLPSPESQHTSAAPYHQNQMHDQTDSSSRRNESSVFPQKNVSTNNVSGNENVTSAPDKVKSEQNGANGNVNTNSSAKGASSKQIANIYMGRLGRGASQKFQESLNMLYKNASRDESPSKETENKDNQGASSNNVTVASDNKVPSQESSASATNSSPSKSGHRQTFSPPGSPNYTDIASDKASHNRNAHTPKGIRRRHSDSDNEENQNIAKLMHKHHLDRHNAHHAQQNSYNDRPALLAETQATSFIGGIPENVPVDSMGNLVELNDSEDNSQKDSSNSSSNNSQSSPITIEVQSATDNGAIPGKKTNLRRANSKGSGNRVSFDPLALLLDASLEGEVELVKRCATQVRISNERWACSYLRFLLVRESVKVLVWRKWKSLLTRSSTRKPCVDRCKVHM